MVQSQTVIKPSVPATVRRTDWNAFKVTMCLDILPLGKQNEITPPPLPINKVLKLYNGMYVYIYIYARR